MFNVNEFNSINPFMKFVLGVVDSVEGENKIVLDFIKNSVLELENELHQSSGDLFSIHFDILNTQISELNKSISGGTDNVTLKNEIEKIKMKFEEFKNLKEDLKNSTSFERSKAIIESLNLADLPTNASLALCYEILNSEQCAFLSVQVIAQEFHNLGMNRITVEQRLAFIEKMAEKGQKASSVALVNFLCKTGLLETNLEQRLNLFRLLIAHGAASEFIKNYKEIGFAEISRKDRFELCLMILEQEVAATFLLTCILGTIDLDISQRLELYMKITEQGAAQLLIHVIETLHLEEATLDQRLKLYMKMITRFGPAMMLVDVVDKLYLSEATAEQRLDLYIKIASHGDLVAMNLLDNFDKLDLSNTTSLQRLKLFETIALLDDSVNNGVTTYLIDNIKKFKMGSETLEERLKIYKAMLKKEDGKGTIKLQFGKLELEKSIYKLDLLKEMINCEVLTLNFYVTGLSKKDAFLYFSYAVSRGVQKDLLVRKTFDFTPDVSFKRQMLIDLLSPPSGLRGSSIPDLQLYGSFLTGAEATIPGRDPIIAILNKKPGELDQTDIQHFKDFVKTQPKLSFLHAFIEKIEADSEATIKKNIEKDAQKSIKEGSEKIRKEAVFAKSELITWSAYAAGILYDCDDDLIAAFSQTKVLELISSYSSPSLRYILIRSFSQLNPSEVMGFYQAITSSKSAATQPTEKQAAPLTQLQKPAFLLTSLTNFGLSPKKLVILQDQILNTRSMKQLSVSSALAQLLFAVNLHGPYETDEADKIADCIIKALKQPEILGKTKKKSALAAQEAEEKINQEGRQQTKEEQTKKDLAALMNVLQIFGKNELIDYVNPENDKISAVSFFQMNFKNLFTIEESADFEKRYQETFGQFRDPMALVSYSRGLDRLPNDAKIVVKETLNIFVNSVLRGDFQEVRSNPANSAHLQHIYTVRPDLQALWNKSLEPKIVSINEAEVKENNEKTKARFLVVETVDPCDLLLFGTDVKKSCQTVYGDPKKNQGLVSILMNGEIRLFAVKEGDKIVARVLLRLLWDDVNHCPVLLQEPLYTAEDHPVFEQAINSFVREKADLMGLNVVSKAQAESKEIHQSIVKFLGGFAPVGYCDSAQGLIPYVNKKKSVTEEQEKIEADAVAMPPAHAAFEVIGACPIYSPAQNSS